MTLFTLNVSHHDPGLRTVMHSCDNKRAHWCCWTVQERLSPRRDQTRLIAKAASTVGDYADSYGYMAEFYLLSGNLVDGANHCSGIDPSRDSNARATRNATRAAREVRAAMPIEQKHRRLRSQRNAADTSPRCSIPRICPRSAATEGGRRRRTRVFIFGPKHP